MAHNDQLKRLFAFAQGNEKHLNDLIERITNNSVVPYVGAGMSAPIFPTWKRFFEVELDAVLISPAKRDEIMKLVDDNEYEKAASVLSKAIGKAGYVDII